MRTDKKKLKGHFCLPVKGAPSAHDFMAPSVTLGGERTIACVLCHENGRTLCVPSFSLCLLGMSCQARGLVTSGCNKTEQDGAGWELRESQLGCQGMSDRRGAKPRVPGAVSKAGGDHPPHHRSPAAEGYRRLPSVAVEPCFLPFFTKLPFSLCVL